MSEGRVLLLNPPTAAVSMEPILNLGYLAAMLRKAGHEVRVIDATAPYRPYAADEIEKIIEEFKPHFIGITLTITFVLKSYEYIKDLRKMGVPIVAGGPHPNAMPHEAIENGADIVCIGEGEETIVELADYFLGNRKIEEIAGIFYRDENKKVVSTHQRRLIQDLDSIPFPDFADFPIKNYTGSDDPNSNMIFWSVFSSRGCPFNCTFCSSHNVFGRTIRLRSAQNVFDEIKGLVERFGAESIAFQDDEILCKKSRFLEFCDLVSNSGLKLKMSIRTRIDSIDPEVLAKAKSAGITRISFGIESWDDETLLRINKKYTVKTIQERFKFLAEAQPLHISFNNICGFPWETRQHYANIVEEISKIPERIKFYLTSVTPIPFPKTKLYDDYVDKYNFKSWWMDPNRQDAFLFEGKVEPFFLGFSTLLSTLYVKDRFWDYSKSKQKDINWFTWKIFGLFMRRHMKAWEAHIVLALCWISLKLWLRSPKVEAKIFSFLNSNEWLGRLKKRVSFTNKY